MNIAYPVKFVYSHEHFADIKACMLFFENTRIVQQSSEVATRNVFHSKIYELWILECIQKSHEPRCFGSCEDVSFNKNVSNLQLGLSHKEHHETTESCLVHLKKCFLSHLLESTDLTSILAYFKFRNRCYQ